MNLVRSNRAVQGWELFRQIWCEK